MDVENETKQYRGAGEINEGERGLFIRRPDKNDSGLMWHLHGGEIELAATRLLPQCEIPSFHRINICPDQLRDGCIHPTLTYAYTIILQDELFSEAEQGIL